MKRTLDALTELLGPVLLGLAFIGYTLGFISFELAVVTLLLAIGGIAANR